MGRPCAERRYLGTMLLPLRTVLPVLLAGLAFSPLQAQRKNAPPPAAMAHLHEQFPKATDLEWKRTSKYFKAELRSGNEPHTAVYTPEGKWVRTEHDIPEQALPEAVKAAVRSGPFASWKVDDMEEHRTPEHPLLYKVTLEDKGKDREVELFLGPTGQIVRQQEKRK